MTDAPGFPEGPAQAAVVMICWLLLVLLAAAAAIATVVLGRRAGRRRGATIGLGLATVALGLVVAGVLWLPATTGGFPEGGSVECPLPTVDGSFMAAKPGTGMYTFWYPCLIASRVRLGVALGGYTVVTLLATQVMRRLARR